MKKFNNIKTGQPIEGGENKTTEAQLLLNNEVKINRGQFAGKTALVRKVMADGRSLEVEVADAGGSSYRGVIALVDVTFVSEIQEPTQYAKTEQSLGPDANSVLPTNRL